MDREEVKRIVCEVIQETMDAIKDAKELGLNEGFKDLMLQFTAQVKLGEAVLGAPIEVHHWIVTVEEK